MAKDRESVPESARSDLLVETLRQAFVDLAVRFERIQRDVDALSAASGLALERVCALEHTVGLKLWEVVPATTIRLLIQRVNAQSGLIRDLSNALGCVVPVCLERVPDPFAQLQDNDQVARSVMSFVPPCEGGRMS